MPALFVFLLKVNIALLLFCAGYYLVLRPLTFYSLNRVYLVAAILFATLYPKINLSRFAERHQQFSKPVQAVVVNLRTPAKALIKPFARPDYWQWIEVVFWAGTIVLAIRLLMQLYSLFKLYRSSKPSRIYDHDVRAIDGDAGPFSFWKSIYVNPANHEPADLKAIILHEQVHISEWHTLDILLAELSTIFYWFNPGVWLMKRAVRENIEFITDQKILKKGIDTKQYQYSLVNVSFSASVNPIVNHFNISTIKKRIIMMNAKRSSKLNLARYILLVPAVVMLLLVFTISKAAVTRKGHLTFKLFSNTVKNLTRISAHPLANAPAIALPSEVSNTKNALAPVHARIVDTLKNVKVSIGTTEPTDSLVYVINGLKMKKADFKNLDPDKINSIEILTGEQANHLLDQIGAKHSVLFVTTNDSEAGKKFKERIDEVNQHSFMLAGKGTTFSIHGPDSNFTIDSKTKRWNMKMPANKFRIERLKKSQLFTGADRKWITINNVRPLVIEEGDDSVEVKGGGIIRKNEFATTTLSKRTLGNAPNVMVYGMHGNGVMYSPKAMTLTGRMRFNNETNISNLSSKMIMINGKRATERDLKKLSAADIESMSVKSGDEITKQYGEKAKDGVVFIETKKRN
jgi:bla regulator protein BlaR1